MITQYTSSSRPSVTWLQFPSCIPHRPCSCPVLPLSHESLSSVTCTPLLHTTWQRFRYPAPSPYGEWKLSDVEVTELLGAADEGSAAGVAELDAGARVDLQVWEIRTSPNEVGQRRRPPPPFLIHATHTNQRFHPPAHPHLLCPHYSLRPLFPPHLPGSSDIIPKPSIIHLLHHPHTHSQTPRCPQAHTP